VMNLTKIPILMLLSTLSFAYVDNNFFTNEKEGWFFYKTDSNETNKSKEQNKTLPINTKKLAKKLLKMDDNKFMKNIPLENLDMFSASDFREINKKAREIAVMKPTKYNVFVVKKLQKFMSDQSEKFAKVWYIETLQNPSLEYPQIKTNPFSLTPAYYKKQKEIKDFFDKYRDRLAFVVFIDGKNDKMQSIRSTWTYKEMVEKYHMTVRFIDVRQRPDLVAKFKIKELPDNFFVYKNSKGEAIWMRIKAGLITKTELINNTMFLVKNAILDKDK